jgi:hypothetical protein
MVRMWGIGLNYASRIFELYGGGGVDVWVGLEYEKN